MNAHSCCEITASDSAPKTMAARTTNVETPPSFARRYLDVAEWIIPGAILAILPKCPGCLAAYIAIGTGVGISVSTAARIRTLVVMLCVVSIVYFATKLVARFRRRIAAQ